MIDGLSSSSLAAPMSVPTPMPYARPASSNPQCGAKPNVQTLLH